MLTVFESSISDLLRPHGYPMNRRGFKCQCAAFFLLLLLMIVFPVLLWAQDIAQVKKGVVKITAQVEGKNKIGSASS